MTTAAYPRTKIADPQHPRRLTIHSTLAHHFRDTPTLYEPRTLDIFQDGKPTRVTLTAPRHWGDNAVATVAEKYLRRAGVPSATIEAPNTPAHIPPLLRPRVPAPDATFGAETSVGQALHRLAGCWAYHALTMGYLTPDDAVTFYHELLTSLEQQLASPNSPQWFNTGLHWAYGIEGQGNTLWRAQPDNPHAAELLPTAYAHPQASACFILGVKDDLVRQGGIMDLWCQEAAIFKGGSGAGVNVSPIRAKGERLSGGGVSSGVMGFLRIGDRGAGAIKSGGTTRRAAKMLCMDDDHPDLLAFVDLKMREEHKVAALVTGSAKTRAAVQAIHDAITAHGHPSPQSRAARDAAAVQGIPTGLISQATLAAQVGLLLLPDALDTDWQGEAYYTVDGQNANNTVRLSHAFMQAVNEGEPWTLKGRVDPSVNATYPARTLFGRIALAAWASGDPGLHFSGTIDEWHTCPEDGKITASNPCVTGDTLVLCWDDEARTTYEKPIAQMCDGPQTIFVDDAPRKIGPAFKTGTKEVLVINFANYHRPLRVTPDHLVSVMDPRANNGVVRDIAAREIEPGMYLCTANHNEAIRVWTITPEPEPQDVYDLTEPQTHHFIANGIRVHNCSEYLFLDNTACNLASINLLPFLMDLDGFPTLDAELLSHTADIWTLALEVSVGMAGYPTPTLACNSARYRTLGLGMANLGALLMQMGLPYGSREGRAMACAVAAILNASAYHTSARLAALMGAYDAYEPNKAHALRVLHNHRAAAVRDLRASWNPQEADDFMRTLDLLPYKGHDPLYYRDLTVKPSIMPTQRPLTRRLYQYALTLYQRAFVQAEQSGLRNAQLTVCAPTGTIAFQMGCDTTGCEPEFALVKVKHYAGGGERVLVNQGVPRALAALGWCEADIKAALRGIEARKAFHHDDPFPEGHKTSLTPDDLYRAAQVLACACAPDAQTLTLAWTDHVAMIAALQAHTSGAISKSVNLPHTATPREIEEAYSTAYRMGVKALAVFRDGSKLSQPLNLPDASKADAEPQAKADAEPVKADDDPQAKAEPTAVPYGAPLTKPDAPRECLGVAVAESPASSPAQAVRMSLPALAESVRVKATLAGHSLYLHTGEYSDGRLGEVFVTMGGQGGDLGAWIGAWAQSVSVALQHGTPFSALARSFLGHTANPSGFVQGLRDIPALTHIRTASSPMDLIFQLLSAFYDDNGMRRDRRPSPDNKPHNDASDNDKPEASDKPARVVTSPTASIGKPKGGGDLCPNCNSFGLRRSGTCQVCEVCHTTTGCS